MAALGLLSVLLGCSDGGPGGGSDGWGDTPSPPTRIPDDAVASREHGTKETSAMNAPNALNAMSMVGSLTASNAVSALEASAALTGWRPMEAMSAMAALGPRDPALTVPVTPPGAALALLGVQSHFDAGTQYGGSSSISDFGHHTAYEIDQICPATTLSYTLPDGVQVSLVLPKFLTLKDTFEYIPDPASPQSPLTVSVVEDGATVPYRVLTGQALACGDKAFRPVFLSPVGAPAELRPYEHDLRYMCLMLKAPDETSTRWRCGKGHLGVGVTGYAVRNDSPRTFLLGSLSWGGNTYTHHFELLAGLGAVAERVPYAKQAGYAMSEGWNLHPLDDGGARAKDYIAGVAVKTATNRSGIFVSPYNHPDRTGGVEFDWGELNQCEEGYSQSEDNLDVASTGNLVNGILVDLQTGPWYQNPSNACPWASDWELKPAARSVTQSASGATCNTFEISSTTNRVGLNLQDGLLDRRCPSWTPCPTGKFCCGAAVSVGSGNTCFLKVDGTAWCWGGNYKGALGTNSTATHSPSAQQVKVNNSIHPLKDLVEISSGDDTGCVRRSDGTIHCWGRNVYGQVGDGTKTDRLGAVQVSNLTGMNALEGGTDHFCAKKSTDNTIWCWGDNAEGQLGNNSISFSGVPVPVQVKKLGTDEALAGISTFASGSNSNCAIQASTGEVWCWGQNDYGQLGDGTKVMRLGAARVKTQTCTEGCGEARTCTQTEPGFLTDAVKVSVGARGGCAIRKDKSLWCWGSSEGGAQGDGCNGGHDNLYATQVRGLSDVEQVYVSDFRTCARRGDKTLWCWGPKTYYQGDAVTRPAQAFDRMTGAPFEDVIDLPRGSAKEHSCFRRSDGRSWCFGHNQRGKLGFAGTTNQWFPGQSAEMSCPGQFPIYEAEDASLLGSALMDDSGAGYTGTGTVTMPAMGSGAAEGSGVKFVVEVPTNGRYDIIFRYAFGMTSEVTSRSIFVKNDTAGESRPARVLWFYPNLLSASEYTHVSVAADLPAGKSEIHLVSLEPDQQLSFRLDHVTLVPLEGRSPRVYEAEDAVRSGDISVLPPGPRSAGESIGAWQGPGHVDFTVFIPKPGPRRFFLKYAQAGAETAYRTIEVDGAELVRQQAFPRPSVDPTVFGTIALTYDFSRSGAHHIRVVHDPDKGSAASLELDLLSVETFADDPYTDPATW